MNQQQKGTAGPWAWQDKQHWHGHGRMNNMGMDMAGFARSASLGLAYNPGIFAVQCFDSYSTSISIIEGDISWSLKGLE